MRHAVFPINTCLEILCGFDEPSIAHSNVAVTTLFSEGTVVATGSQVVVYTVSIVGKTAISRRVRAKEFIVFGGFGGFLQVEIDDSSRTAFATELEVRHFSMEAVLPIFYLFSDEFVAIAAGQ